MTEDYRCKHCGMIVTVQAVRVPLADFAQGETCGLYTAWCRCSETSPTDKNHRGVGNGNTPEEAVKAWRNWSAADGRSN